ncbi:MAG: DUF362 domain-containing protein [Tepidanaerobacteraceae bacterium]|jgi:uncharacterized protein (DUF362 family)|nr:DUF362 domain-containing protein [Thermoanaerobacterales bacterium]
MDRNIYIVYGNEAKSMTLALLEAANVKERIPKGASIGLKPNLVVAKSAESGATTHKGIAEGIIEYLMENGHKQISIMESSWVGGNTRRAFNVSGYDALSKKYGVPLYDLKRDATTTVDTAIGKMEICQRALDTDYLINLPVLKGHCQTTITCALKNCKGCLPDSEKRRFHALGLHKPIAALAAVLKPALTIVDSICGDLNFEEGGTPVQTNRMLLGEDMVQLDAFGCKLMGIDVSKVEYIALAEKYGAGKADFSNDDLIQVNSPDAILEYPKSSGLVRRLGKNVKQKDACSACYGNLIHALYRLELENYPYTAPIAIGQGWKGIPFDGVGIGRCCDCAKKRINGCPPNAETIMAGLRAYLHEDKN